MLLHTITVHLQLVLPSNPSSTLGDCILEFRVCEKCLIDLLTFSCPPDTGVVKETLRALHPKITQTFLFFFPSVLVNQIAFPFLYIPIPHDTPESSAGPEKLNPHLPMFRSMFISKRHPVSLPCHHRRIIEPYNGCETGHRRELPNPASLIYRTNCSTYSTIRAGTCLRAF